MAELSDITTSKVRIKVIELLYSNPNEMYHVRAIVRQIKEEINAVRRELSRLEEVGVIKKEPRGNRIYYSIRADYSFYADLLSLTCKTTGLGAQIISNRNKLGRINHMVFSGRFARNKDRKKDDEVDILVVGEVVLAELATLIRAEESKRGREINYTVMTREEFDFRKKRRDPFLLSILATSRVMVIGDEDVLINS